jgi:hypothetical protein
MGCPKILQWHIIENKVNKEKFLLVRQPWENYFFILIIRLGVSRKHTTYHGTFLPKWHIVEKNGKYKENAPLMGKSLIFVYLKNYA